MISNMKRWIGVLACAAALLAPGLTSGSAARADGPSTPATPSTGKAHHSAKHQHKTKKASNKHTRTHRAGHRSTHSTRASGATNGR